MKYIIDNNCTDALLLHSIKEYYNTHKNELIYTSTGLSFACLSMIGSLIALFSFCFSGCVHNFITSCWNRVDCCPKKRRRRNLNHDDRSFKTKALRYMENDGFQD